MKLRSLVRKTLKTVKVVKEDYTHEYWDNVAKKDLPHIMDRITTDYTPKDFAESKDSIIFTLDIPFKKDQVVLDLACGLGRTCKWVSSKVETYYGVDFVENMVNKARKYNEEYKNAHFYKNNGSNLSKLFSENSIDIAYCELAFQHMPKQTQIDYIDQLYKVLKPEGKFYVQIPKQDFYKRKETSWNDNEIHSLFSKWVYYRLLDTYPAYYTVIATAKIPFK